jgi:hypothetical protein
MINLAAIDYNPKLYCGGPQYNSQYNKNHTKTTLSVMVLGLAGRKTIHPANQRGGASPSTTIVVLAE